MTKKRLDDLLVERVLFDTKKEAEAAIREGRVRAGGQVVSKPGVSIDEGMDIEIFTGAGRYVSRGGVKLEHALREFGVRVEGKVAFDAGASTGGFTDCFLQQGASTVVAVDVGYGQLAWRLRRDPRVEVWERTNLRQPPEQLLHRWNNRIEVMALDLSFISLGLILPAVAPVLCRESDIIALVKPQFEAPREKVGPKGVVRDPAEQVTAIQRVMEAGRVAGYAAVGVAASPIRGPEGNLEFFVHFTFGSGSGKELDIDAVVHRAHETVK